MAFLRLELRWQILASVGLPMEGVGSTLAIDRILNMMRTSVNIFNDSCSVAIIAKSVGEEGILTG